MCRDYLHLKQGVKCETAQPIEKKQKIYFGMMIASLSLILGECF